MAKTSESFEDQIREKLRLFDEQAPEEVWQALRPHLPRNPGWMRPGVGYATVIVMVGLTTLLWLGLDRRQPKAPSISTTPVLPDTLMSEGARLFHNYCAPCHARDMTTPITGPALAGVTQRRSMDWLIAFTRNSQAMIQAGDSTAMAVWKKWQPVIMTSFPELTEEDIRGIYAYVEEQAGKR